MAFGIDKIFFLTYCLLCCWPAFGADNNLRVVNQWAALDFRFPDAEARQRAIDNRFYVPGFSVPIDVDMHQLAGKSPRTFVTNPRFDEGRPVTLGTVDAEGFVTGYPDFSWHDNQGSNCDGMTSVFRVAIDQCNRLWVMDSGKIGPTQACPPQLLAFDLTTDQLIYRHKVNASNYVESSLFINPVVDVRGVGPNDCADTFVYVGDVTGYGLLVVDVAKDRSWRLSDPIFHSFESHGTFTIDGESFVLMDGVLGMALTPYKPGQDRSLYFHALASTTENVVSTSVLRSGPNVDSKAFTTLPGERPNQSAAEAIDNNGILYFGLMDPPSIWCWNTATEFSTSNFHQIAKDQETLQFASGMKIVNNLQGKQELWALTSSFQRVMTGSINSNRINFRIHTEEISKLLQNSPCALPTTGNQ